MSDQQAILEAAFEQALSYRLNLPEAECRSILNHPDEDPKTGKRIVMAHPAYDQCIQASHIFNLLDARGVISVTERQAYIGRVRALAKACADAFVDTEAGGRAA